MSIHCMYTAPEVMQSALLTIDMQKDFVEHRGASPIEGTVERIPAMTRMLEAYRKNGLPIVHVVRLYKPGGANADLCRRALLESGKQIVTPGSSGAELVSGFTLDLHVRLDPVSLLAGQMQSIRNREWLMYKPRWDAFHNTPLESHLHSLNVTTVVIVGCNFPNCPRSTAYGASMRDFRVVLVTDATSGIYERGIQELKNIAIKTPTANEWIAQVDRSG